MYPHADQLHGLQLPFLRVDRRCKGGAIMYIGIGLVGLLLLIVLLVVLF